MSSLPTLTEGALEKMLADGHVEKPIMQVLAAKQMADNRLRCVITDGVTSYSQAVVIEPNFTRRVISGELDPKFTVIRVDRYIVNCLNNQVTQPVLIIQMLTVVMPGTQVSQKLGSIGGLMNDSMRKTDNSLGNANVTAVENSSRMEKSVFAPNSTSHVKTNSTAETNNFFNNKYRPNASSTAGAGTINPEAVCPITAITPYYNAWTIRVRVTSKGTLRTYSNLKGEGKLFSFDVTDKDGEIRITAFNSECDKFFNLIEVDMIYYISRGSVKTANKKFTNLNNEFEITLNSDSVIELCTEAIELPKLKFRFTGISELESIAVGTCVDVIGVIRNVGNVESIVGKKSNKELKKRDIVLMDKTCGEVRFTVWGEVAELFNGNIGDILAVKSAVIGEFKGKTLSTTSGSTIQINPDLAEAHTLKGWYDREGRNATVVSLSKASDGGATNLHKYLCQANLETVGDTPLFFNAKGTIMTSGRAEKSLYKACSTTGCLKGVKDQGNGLYHCLKCNKSEPTFVWQIILSVCIADCTGDMWVTMFRESAEKIIGKNSKELSELFENEPNEFQAEIAKINFRSYTFRIGSRIEEYNGERRVKSSGYSAVAVDPVDRAKRLLQCIRAWNQ